MKYRILLVCAAGMSTSLIVEKMKQSAKEKGVELVIDALPEAKAKKVLEEFEVVLLGPQISYLEDNFKELLSGTNIPLETINMQDYGLVEGEKILIRAIELIEGKKNDK